MMVFKTRVKGFRSLCVSCGGDIFNRLSNAKYCKTCSIQNRQEYVKEYNKKYREGKK